MDNMHKISIMIADDQTLMSIGLQTIINLEEDMEVVGVATNGLQAFEMVGELRPQLLLMDIQMPVMNGLESMKLIRKHYPDTRVLILSTFAEDEYILEGLAKGACGFMLKDIDGDVLINSIRSALKDQYILPAVIASKLAAQVTRLSALAERDYQLNQLKMKELNLSGREMDIVKLLVQGMNNSQMAAYLHISEGTVKNYISMIYTKIGISNRAKAIAYLREIEIHSAWGEA